MPQTHEQLTALIGEATRAAQEIGRAVEGKPADHSLETNAGSLAELSGLLVELTTDAAARRSREITFEAALLRIAHLKGRNARELVENGNWKKLCSELQAIAQDALGL